jgi:hypothetical protein
VLRAWELTVEQTLTGPLGLVPLTLLTDEAQTDLSAAVARIEQRFRAEADPTTASDLWAITATLGGLRVDLLLLRQLLGRLTRMEENTFVQWMNEEGRIREARDIILRLGRRRFGEPDAAMVQRLNALQDRAQLEELTDRILDAPSWTSLLANVGASVPSPG